MNRIVTWTFYGALVLVLALTLTATIKDVLPGGLGGAAANNSEGLLMALATALWIQYARPRLSAGSGFAVAVVVGVASFLVGWWLLQGPLERPDDSRFITLNEKFFALAVMIPYLQLRRPLPGWFAPLLPLVAIIVPAIGGSNEQTTDLAETFCALVLLPITFDYVDRGILDGARARVLAAVGWIGLMVLIVASFHTLVNWSGPSTLPGQIMLYLARGNEMFVAAGLLTAYFSLLRPDLRSEQASAPIQSTRASDAVGRARATAG